MITSRQQLQKMVSLIDLTLLKEDASQDEINELALNATKYKTAAICLYGKHLKWLPMSLPVKVATVVNFPSGELATESVLDEISTICALYSINEIDYVFPYKRFLAGNKTEAFDSYQSIYDFCKQKKLTFKTILETGAYSSTDDIYALCRGLLEIGADFLKTSTGKIEQGASLSAAFAILTAVQDARVNCGIKISGGIKEISQAQEYINMAEWVLTKPVQAEWFRIGASSLLKEIISQMVDG